MKRITFALFAASLALFVISLATLSPTWSVQRIPKDGTVEEGSTSSGPPPDTVPVEVTNAVTGAMDVRNFPLRQEVFGTVSVDNFPVQQTVTGTVEVGNLPAQQEVFGTVTIANLPSVQQRTFLGVSTLMLKGDRGFGRYNAACHDDFPGSRMCTTKEYIETVNPPEVETEAWIRPDYVRGGYGSVIDITGSSSTPGYMSCAGWTNDSYHGLTIAPGGVIFAKPCSPEKPIACCG
jgi:hypothetical protein